MKVTFAPSFFKSLKRLYRQNTWWYKTYEFFRYNLWRFFGNIWKFRKELYSHRDWDSSYSLGMLRRSLIIVCDGMEKYGNEEPESRLKKINKMRRAIEIIEWHEKDLFVGLAEKELGYDVNCDNIFGDEPEEIRQANKVVFDLSTKIENDSWKELFEILKGQDYTQFDKDNDWYSQFDGSGMKGWWD